MELILVIEVLVVGNNLFDQFGSVDGDSRFFHNDHMFVELKLFVELRNVSSDVLNITDIKSPILALAITFGRGAHSDKYDICIAQGLLDLRNKKQIFTQLFFQQLHQPQLIDRRHQFFPLFYQGFAFIVHEILLVRRKYKV
jgi:hypothetical protein